MKKSKILLALLSAIFALCLGVFAFAGCANNGGNNDGNDDDLDKTVCTHEHVTHKNYEAADCTANGNYEYWYCRDCKKYYSDSALTNETSLSAVTIAATHKYGEFVYDYNAMKYVKTCERNGEHTADQAAGTEEYPYLAKDDASLTAAVAKGGHIKVEKDITVSQTVLITKAATVDLNNCVVSNASDNAAVYCIFLVQDTVETVTIKNGEINIYGMKTDGFAIYAKNENVSKAKNPNVLVENVDIVAHGYISGVGAHFNTNVKVSDSTITDAYYAAAAWKDATLEFANCEIVGLCGVIGQGTAEYGANAIIKLNDTNITTEYGAVYFPAIDGQLAIKGGKITSASEAAIELRAGTTVIEGAEVKCTATTFGYNANSSGSTITNGVALAVSQHKTDNDIALTVNGSTLTGLFAIYEQDVQNDTARDKISITLGTGDKANILNGLVYSENCDLAGEQGYEWVYNYATYKYEYKLTADGTVAISKAAGAQPDPYLVKVDADLTATLAKGGYIKLTDSVEATRKVVSKTVTIDLNGKTITSASNAQQGLFYLAANTGAVVTIKNGTLVNNSNNYVASGETTASKTYAIYSAASTSAKNAPKLFLSNVTVNSSNFKSDGSKEYKNEYGVYRKCAAMYIGDYVQATLDNCVINGGYYGFNYKANSQITMTDCEINDTYSPLQGNGGEHGTVVNLTNTDINSYYGIYHPQDGVMNITGGTIDCVGTAVEIRAGKVTITGATLSSSFGFTTAASESANSTSGCAVAVSQHSTDKKIEVVIDGCTLNGVYSLYEYDFMNETARDVISVDLKANNILNGGVYSQNCANIVAKEPVAA